MIAISHTIVSNARCHVPECEEKDKSLYDAEWVDNAIPHIQSRLAKCQKYSYVDSDKSHELSSKLVELNRPSPLAVCSAEQFNQSKIVRCENDGFVYRTEEISIANEVSFRFTRTTFRKYQYLHVFLVWHKL